MSGWGEGSWDDPHRGTRERMKEEERKGAKYETHAREWDGYTHGWDYTAFTEYLVRAATLLDIILRLGRIDSKAGKGACKVMRRIYLEAYERAPYLNDPERVMRRVIEENRHMYLAILEDAGVSESDTTLEITDAEMMMLHEAKSYLGEKEYLI